MTSTRFIVEPHVFGLWRILDMAQNAGGDLFHAPIVLVATSQAAAERAAAEMNEAVR